MSSRRAARWLAFPAVLIVAAAVAALAAWWLAPAWLPRAAAALLPAAVDVESLVMSRPGMTAVHVAEASLHLESANGRTSVTLRDVEVSYDLLGRRLRGVAVGEARLDLAVPLRGGGGAAAGASFSLPLDRLSVHAGVVRADGLPELTLEALRAERRADGTTTLAGRVAAAGLHVDFDGAVADTGRLRTRWQLGGVNADLAELLPALGAGAAPPPTAMAVAAAGSLARTAEGWTLDFDEASSVELTATPGLELHGLTIASLRASAGTGLAARLGDGRLRLAGPLSLEAAGSGVSATLALSRLELPLAGPWTAAGAAGRLRASLALAGEQRLAAPVALQVDAPVLDYAGAVAFAGGELGLSPRGSRLRFGAARLVAGAGAPPLELDGGEIGIDGEIALRMAEGLSVAGGRLALTAGEPVALRLTGEGTDLLAAQDVRFALDAAWDGNAWLPRLDGRLSAGATTVAGGALSAASAAVRLADSGLAPLHLLSRIELEGIAVEAPRLSLPAERAAGGLTVTGEALRFDGDLWPRAASAAQPVTADFDYASGAAAVSLPSLKLDAADVQPFVRQMIAPIVPGIRVSRVGVTGRLALTVGRGPLRGAGSLLLDDIEASLAQLRVASARHRLELRSLDPLVMAHEVEAPAVELGSDLRLTALRASLTSEGAGGRIDSLQADVLDGRVSLRDVPFGADRIGPATLELATIDIGALLAWLNFDGLSGEGSLSASLPLTGAPGALTVHTGTFEAAPDGVIRYTGAAESALGSNIAARALEDFRFELLEGAVEYGAGGDYAARISLLGANPALYDGYPVRLNLNLSGRLPGVLQAALLTGDFSEAIIREYQAEQARQREAQ